MRETYEVTWAAEVEADDPLDAARRVYERLRSSSTRPTRFNVGHPKIAEVLGSDQALVIELPAENPLGRPVARIEGDGVRCPYCGSENTHYVETVGQYGPLSVKDGNPVCWSGDLDVNEVGDDPHVLCFGCGRESQLPSGFEWA